MQFCRPQEDGEQGRGEDAPIGQEGLGLWRGTG